MSHTKILAATAAVLAFTGAAQAQTTCPSGTTQLTTAQLSALLPNRMACVGTLNNWEGQVHHVGSAGSTGGAIWDQKLGTDPRDPAKELGTYAINNNQVTYNYTGGGSFTYAVCAATGSYTFVSSQRTMPGITIGGLGRQSCNGLPNESVPATAAAPIRKR